MAESKVVELIEKLDARAADLQRTQKHLQKPSTLSFVDRRDLSNKAGKALAELQEQRAALDGKSDDDEGVAALLTEAEAALGRADGVLNRAGTSGKGASHTSAGVDRGKVGQGPHGAVGASQQRGPDRKGGD